MGLIDQLKKLFGGGSKPSVGDEGIYLYVRLDRRGEIVRLRLNPAADLNPDDERGGHVSRKQIVGPRTFERAAATFHFDEHRRLVEAEVEGGSLASELEWLRQEQAAPSD